MTDPVEIDLTELNNHRQLIGEVVDQIATARDAAHAAVGRDAFGAFGYFLAEECATAAAEGTEMLAAAHDAADELHRKLGLWAQDTQATEGEISALFSTAPVMRNA
jgi:hypothetical protein